LIDEGARDKRLLVVETEFASTLRVLGRDGNTLSQLLRHAWDDGLLRSMTKNSPVVATDAHVSIIGHITRDELDRDLDLTETANGFANRFLWVWIKRARVLPEGGNLESIDFAGLITGLRAAVNFASRAGELKRDPEATALWRLVYPALSDGKPGLRGAVTSRAEAQVTRLALIYALLDCEPVIRRVHLEAALALWGFCDASCRMVFGDTLGDPIADEILIALREEPAGLMRTQIRDLFLRHSRPGAIARALRLLEGQGLARSERVETGGRPGEKWVAARDPSHAT
jgi:hypothetical protein